MRHWWLWLAAVPALAGPASDRIGSIDFYGYGGVDVGALRAAMPFHEGGRLPSKADRNLMMHAVRRITGRDGVLAAVCCLANGRSALYIGVAEAGAPAVVHNAAPQGEGKLPGEVLDLFRQMETDLAAAVRKGESREDDTQGYALFADARTRADQMGIREWARAHTPLVLKVLAESRYAQQRAYAAQALGYAERSTEQIAALVAAAFDADDGVRNGAVRALEVLCTVGKEVTGKIPAERFIPLLHSLEWTDRNKGSLLFLRMTESRDPGLLKVLREQAMEPLREMARWTDFSHARPALIILGRIAGTDEIRLERMDALLVDEILRVTAPVSKQLP